MNVNKVDGTISQTITDQSLPKFQKGEVFYGKIKQLYQHQYATITIGGRELTAQLLTPLELNKSYWFQVVDVDGKLIVKTITPKFLDDPNDFILKHLSIPLTKERRMIVEYFQKHQLPLTKELLMEASHLIKQSQSMEVGVNVIGEMVKKGLPIRHEIFQSLLEQTLNRPVTHLLNQLLNEIPEEDHSNPTIKKLEHMLQQLLWSNPKKIDDIQNELLLRVIEPQSSEHIAQNSFQLLKNWGLFPNLATKEQFIQILYHSLFEPIEQDVSINQMKEKIVVMLNKQNNDHAPLLNVLKQMEIISSNVKHETIFQFLRKDHLLVQQLLNQKIPKVVEWKNGTEVAHFIRDIIKEIGFQYEYDKFVKLNVQEEQTTLKELLLQLVKSEQASSLSKTAEQVLYRITGQQLFNESSSTMIQYQLQIPIAMFDQPIDATISWTGKKDETGKIDPNFCRILFVLQLESLGDLAIDLNIQNRIISMRIFNEHPLIEKGIQQFFPMLKERLQSIEYHLQSVVIKPFQEQKNLKMVTKGKNDPIVHSKLDVRI